MSTVVQTPTGGFEAALLSDEPRIALLSEVKKLLDDGYPRTGLVHTLGDFSHVLRDQGRHDSEDVVLDVLDLIEGWAAPHAVL